jgi:hypothetical protein
VASGIASQWAKYVKRQQNHRSPHACTEIAWKELFDLVLIDDRVSCHLAKRLILVV